MSERFQIILGLIAIAVIGVAAWIGLSALARLFTGIDKTVAAAFVAGFVALSTAVFTYWRERQKSREEAYRDKKIEIYSIFLGIIFDVLKESKNKSNSNAVERFLESQKFQKDMNEFWRGLLFYGSPGVIKSVNEWKLQSSDSGGNVDHVQALERIGNIILQMRKDLGLSNWGLDSLSLHQIYVNDDLRSLGGEQ